MPSALHLPLEDQKQPDRPRRKNPWFAPLGCLSILALLVGAAALFLYSLLAELKDSEPYRHAVEQARHNLTVQSTLGTPVRPSFFVTGSVDDDPEAGRASLAIPLSGPNADAILFVEATRRSGQWRYWTLTVELDDTRERIQLGAPFPDRD